jgi:ABC-type proline/glycine betaine transport system ATPase subunit
LGVFFSLITDYCLWSLKKHPSPIPLKIMYSTDVVTDAVLRTKNLNVYYGSNLAVRDVNLDIPEKKAIAFIGSSGCGKSTVLRCFNRMNDLVKSAKIEGKVTFGGKIFMVIPLILWGYAVASVWFFRNRILSPNLSMKISLLGAFKWLHSVIWIN